MCVDKRLNVRETIHDVDILSKLREQIIFHQRLNIIKLPTRWVVTSSAQNWSKTRLCFTGMHCNVVVFSLWTKHIYMYTKAPEKVLNCQWWAYCEKIRSDHSAEEVTAIIWKRAKLSEVLFINFLPTENQVTRKTSHAAQKNVLLYHDNALAHFIEQRSTN